jgi:hypothetical protein
VASRPLTINETFKHEVPKPSKWLSRAVGVWFGATVLGQFLFFIYISVFYGYSAQNGDFAAWSKHRNYIDGYVASDLTGNIFFGAHVLMAAILTFGGVLQLWPRLRNAARPFHRWNGRIFVASALVAAFGGLWLVWVRGSMLDLGSGLGVSVNGVLIIWFAIKTYTCARARNYKDHQIWATRLFLAVSGVWFLRVGLMAMALIGVGGLGLPKEIMDPFFVIWSFGNSLVPLAIYEMYRRVKSHGSPTAQYGMAAGFFGLTGLTLVGTTGAVMAMWGPALKSLLNL